MKKKIIGYASVDSGQLVIVDPCYLRAWKDGEYRPDTVPDNHYAKACVETLKQDGGGEILVSGTAGIGVAVQTGYGDGNYPVEAHYGDEGRIEKIVVSFMLP